MKIYLVGGAVRDKLLGLEPKERDWVVVGASPEELLALGYTPVGKDFPVFLHPETKEEYALARTERKTAPGYTGFTFHAAPDVTLEEDLARRDLTINAIAEDTNGKLIDPFNGRQDIEAGMLRHVSAAFVEDPVRILRCARFAARFARFGFKVAHGTNALMRKMVENGEVDALVAERVWKEFETALKEDRPTAFFKVLRGCGALARLFPEIDALYGVPQPEQHHPEIDTGVHVMMVLDQATQLTTDPRIRFAALTHDLGKGATPKEEWPQHIGHEASSVKLVHEMCDRLRIPNDYRDIAALMAEYHTHCHRAFEIKPATLLKVLEALDAFRREERLEMYLTACLADARGCKDREDLDYPQADRFRAAFVAARAITARTFVEQGLKGEAISKALREARIEAIAALD
ncbi:multifunctional CCA addition/repair protein [Sulfuriflexus mobilis]|uniref:multifunctional CCA addition/repair protein n=1 Tax=Sulfuriflexus mobilis TaxID=1811807 RepID=UPI000F825E86|nr:multifunctional CCA addition/repair protein [Sulfuriflexus mobilis]